MRRSFALRRAFARWRALQGTVRFELCSIRALLSQRPRAAYIGWTGYHNLGDDVLLQAHRMLLEGVTVIEYRRSRLLGPLCALLGRRLYDLGILGGGTLINQHHRWLTSVIDLQDGGVPMVCIGTGVASAAFWTQYAESESYVGHSGDELEAWRSAIMQFSYVGVRGPYSLAVLSGCGLEAVEVVGDTALSLTDFAGFRDCPQESTAIGLNCGHEDTMPMWGGWETYRDELIRFIRLTCDSGLEVRLLPVAARDVPSNQAILASVDRASCKLVCAYDSLEQYSRAVRECDAFVGQKLHSTVIACMNGVPSLMVEYRPKCRDFMASLGFEEFVVRTDDFNADDAIAKLNALRRDRQAVRRQLAQRIGEYQLAQQSIAAAIREFLLKESTQATMR
jgi:hypothetical protein